MLTLRPHSERGGADHGWLRTHFTFSFADYHDPDHMGFRALRVINEDRIRGGSGFPMHSHRDMEIITYVVSGALEHKDSMGNTTVIRPDEVQRMSAGTGVQHSEFNHFKDKDTHLLQIWILPKQAGFQPGYGQKSFSRSSAAPLVLAVSSDGRDGSISMNQDAELYLGRIAAGKEVSHELRPGRHAWVQVVKGSIDVLGSRLSPGDGAAISDEPAVPIRAVEAADFLLFELP